MVATKALADIAGICSTNTKIRCGVWFHRCCAAMFLGRWVGCIPVWPGRRGFSAPKQLCRVFLVLRWRVTSILISIFRPDENVVVYSDFQQALGGYDSLSVFQHYYDRAGTDDLLSRIQYVDIKTYLPDDILAKVDRASMAVSLEVRAPLLDHHLMEHVATMPSLSNYEDGRASTFLRKP